MDENGNHCMNEGRIKVKVIDLLRIDDTFSVCSIACGFFLVLAVITKAVSTGWAKLSDTTLHFCL